MAGTTRDRAQEAGAKLPKDRAASAEATGEVVTVTVDGREFVVDPADLSDYRIMRRIHLGDESAALDMIARILGEHEDAVADELEDEKGRVSVQKMTDYMQRVLKEAGWGNS